jgi:hypothetical protein
MIMEIENTVADFLEENSINNSQMMEYYLHEFDHLVQYVGQEYKIYVN